MSYQYFNSLGWFQPDLTDFNNEAVTPNMFFSNNNVGIGITAPRAKLDVVGNIFSTSNITTSNDIIADGNLKLKNSTYSETSLNAWSNTAYFASNAASFTSNNFLRKQGDILQGNLYVKDNQDQFILERSNDSVLLFGASNNIWDAPIMMINGRYAALNPGNMILSSTNNGAISFSTHSDNGVGTEWARIENGGLAIGKLSATQRLDVAGSVNVESNLFVRSNLFVNHNVTFSNTLSNLGNAFFSSNIVVNGSLGLGSTTYTEVALNSWSNTAYTSSNASVFASNTGVFSSNLSVTSSNDLYPRANFASNTSVFSSNLSVFSSNIAIGNSNRSVFASNAAVFASNNLNNASSTSIFASNLAVTSSNDLYVRSSFASNALSNYLPLTGGIVRGQTSFLSNIAIGHSTQNNLYAVDVAGTVNVNKNQALNNKLLVLYDQNSNDTLATACNFYGFGINDSTLRYQVPRAIDNHAWFNGTSNTMLLNGTGLGLNVIPTTMLDVNGSALIRSNLTINGNLSVLGTTTTVNSTQVNITDNIIRLNNGAAFNANLQAGIEVNRGGTLCNYNFLFDEASQYFKVGQTGQLQTVATREDAPVVNSIPFYNSTSARYDSSGSLTFSNNTLNIGSGTMRGSNLLLGSSTYTDTNLNAWSNTLYTTSNVAYVTSNALYPQTMFASNALSNYLPLTSGTLSGDLSLSRSSFVAYNLLNNIGGNVNIGLAYVTSQYSSSANSNDLIIRNQATTGKIILQQGIGAGGLIVNSNNTIGIGTNIPREALHVAGKIYSTQQILADSNDSSNAPAFSFMGDSNTGMWQPAEDTLGFVTGGVDRVRIDSVGRVGLGTASPAYNLDVNGSVRIGGNAVNNKLLALFDLAPTDAVATACNFYGFGVNGGTLRYQVDSFNSRHAFFCFTSNIANITNRGIGIFTTNPQHSLDVVGAIRSTSNIVSESNILSLSTGTVGWPYQISTGFFDLTDTARVSGILETGNPGTAGSMFHQNFLNGSNNSGDILSWSRARLMIRGCSLFTHSNATNVTLNIRSFNSNTGTHVTLTSMTCSDFGSTRGYTTNISPYFTLTNNQMPYLGIQLATSNVIYRVGPISLIFSA